MKKRESPDFSSPEVGISEDDGEIIVYQNPECVMYMWLLSWSFCLCQLSLSSLVVLCV